MVENFPNSEPKTKPLRIGPGRDAKIEARLNGPDPVVLRELSEKVQQIMADDGGAINIKDDWRQPVKVLRPTYNEKTAIDIAAPRILFGKISEIITQVIGAKVIA